MSNLSKSEKLMNKGFEALEVFDNEEALEIGKKLLKLKHTSGFEILAIAQYRDGKVQEAIEILKEGVIVGPEIWDLWQLLGNYNSESEDYEEAQQCFSKALGCEYRDSNSINYNSSIAFSREGKVEHARRKIDVVDIEEIEKEGDTKLFALVAAQKVRVLNELGKLEEAKEFLGEVSDKIGDISAFASEMSLLLSAHAHTLLLMGNREESLLHLWRSIEFDKKNQDAAYLIREIENIFSEDAKYFRCMVEGVWHESFDDGKENPGFYCNYDVVAASLDQALKFVKRFEPVSVQDDLKIVESEILDEKCKDPLGVYSSDGYIFFQE